VLSYPSFALLVSASHLKYLHRVNHMQRSRRPQRANYGRSRSFSNLNWEQLEARRLLAADILGREFVAGEILVQYTAQATPLQQAKARAAIGGEVKEVIQTRIMQEAGVGRLERVSFGRGIDLARAIEALERNPAVAYAEPNYIFRPAATSNDTYYTNGSLWGMYSDDAPATGPSNTTNQFGSHAEKAWAENITGSSSIVVGIIDEGIQVNHPDLVDNIWVNPYEVAGDGIDNDGNGYVDDIYGWDFVNNDNSVYDAGGDSHGTHVAGTIGGKGGNGTGVVGVNWNVKMISAKFLGTTGGTLANAVRAVDYLTDLKVRHGINLVASNNSWGGGGYSQTLHDAIIRHAKQNILFVAAAGNSTSNNDATASYPSNYNTTVGTSTQTPASYDGVIAVASITNTGAISSFSSYGATTVDIGAPGSGIWSTVPSNTYASYNGTSMATPHVTGAVALYASAQTGTVSAATIKQAILDSATPTASLTGKSLTGGRLNVYAALNQGTDETAPEISGLSVSAGSTTATLLWTTNEGATTEVLYGTDPGNLNLTYTDNGLVLNHAAGLTGLNSETTYYFQARSRDGAGNTTTTAVQSFTTIAAAPILFVDDDFGQSFDTFYTAALQAGGYAFDTWNVSALGGSTPSSAVLGNYDLVIWNTGAAFSGTGAGLASGEQSAIANYLNAGGRIFISGQDVLYTGVTSSFQQSYLKVASFTNDVRQTAHTATGVAGHPIGDGLSLAVASPAGFGTLYVDALTPVTGAAGWLNHGVNSSSPFSAVSYRGDYTAGGFGIVFSSAPFEAISNSAANPNNQNTVLKRVIEFLLPSGNPAPGIIVGTPTSNSATTEAGGVVSFTVALAAQPSSDVTIPLGSSDASEGAVSVSQLVFTPTNWNVPQTVTVTGVNDNVDDGNLAYSIVLGAATSADAGYNGLNAGDVALSNLDDDTAGITRGTPSGTTTTEAGGAVTFGVRLNSEPTANVTIGLNSSDTTEGAVSANSLIFTAANWNVEQTVTVIGVDDAIFDGNIAYTIVVAAATSSDPLYNTINPADVSLTNLDNDPAPPSKFYVVDDATQNRTYEYDASGAAIENYLVNSGNAAPRGAAMTAAGDKVWVVDANRNVYVYNTSGGLLGSWTAGTLASNATVQGIATDGTHIWIVDARADRVFYYANAASRLSGTQTASSFVLGSGNTSPSDIVFGSDGASRYLWVVNSSTTDRVYRYSVGATGGISLLNSWALNSANSTPTGITLDPSNGSLDIWVADSGTDRVYRYANARNLLAPTLTSSFALAAGNTNPQGIADPPPPGSSDEPLETESRFVANGFLPVLGQPLGPRPEVVANRGLTQRESNHHASPGYQAGGVNRVAGPDWLSRMEAQGSRQPEQWEHETNIADLPLKQLATIDAAFAQWN
jgi:subtilisin family serine protease